jgi:hypothetical protein
MLPEVDKVLDELGVLVQVREKEAELDEESAVAGNRRSEGERERERKEKEGKYAGGKSGYWDDYCLALFLRGVCMRYVAYPVCFYVISLFLLI